jgi:predicted restriction endonuclease
MVSKAEWAAIKAIHKNKCVICGKTEKQVGILEQVHIKARSRGGTQVVPMCPTHHKMYDQNKLSATQLKKLGQTPATAKRLTPPKRRRQTDNWSWW